MIWFNLLLTAWLVVSVLRTAFRKKISCRILHFCQWITNSFYIPSEKFHRLSACLKKVVWYCIRKILFFDDDKAWKNCYPISNFHLKRAFGAQKIFKLSTIWFNCRTKVHITWYFFFSEAALPMSDLHDLLWKKIFLPPLK